MPFMQPTAATSRIIESPLNPRGREGTPESDRYFWSIGTVLAVAIWSCVSVCSIIALVVWSFS
jgi:hypothetical protein